MHGSILQRSAASLARRTALTRTIARRTVATNLAATAPQVVPPQTTTSTSWKDAGPVPSSSSDNSATIKHLQQVSQAIEKVLMEKEAAKAAESRQNNNAEDASTNLTLEAWNTFDLAYENAKSCVDDVLANEAPEHFSEEMETAEQALTEVQAAYLDVLDECRSNNNDKEERREEAAIRIRELRQRLDAVTSTEA